VVPQYKSVNPAKDSYSVPGTPPMPRVRLKSRKNQQADAGVTQEAIPVDDGTATAPVTAAMIQALIPLGLKAVEDALLGEVEQLAGPRYGRGEAHPAVVRWGAQRGSVYLADQKLAIAVPRVRDRAAAREVPLATYAARHDELIIGEGDNPERLRNERSFAALCGVAPLDVSSGRQQRHRLNRGGNRDANRALWVIAFVRWRMHPKTKAYAARRMTEGRTKLEILRCLKRYIAREVFELLHAASANIPQATQA